MSVKAYNHAIYNLLGDVAINSKTTPLQDIYELGKIIVKHGYVNHVCVIIAHRHFDLGENEVMYEVAESGKRIAEPRPLFDVVNGKAQPNLLSCSTDGSWYPVGYEEADPMFSAWDNTKFLAEAAKYLIDNNLTDKLAIASRRSVDEKRNGVVFVEENNYAKRQSTTRPSSNEKLAATKAIPTTYSFDENAITAEEGCTVCNNCIIH